MSIANDIDFLNTLGNPSGNYLSTPNNAGSQNESSNGILGALGNNLGMDFSSLSGFGNALLGGKDTPGLLSMGMDLYGASKQYGLMEDTLELNQDKFKLSQNQYNTDKAFANRNLANQASTINSAMNDRQRARIASGGNYESLSSYMDKNRVDGSAV